MRTQRENAGQKDERRPYQYQTWPSIFAPWMSCLTSGRCPYFVCLWKAGTQGLATCTDKNQMVANQKNAPTASIASAHFSMMGGTSTPSRAICVARSTPKIGLALGSFVAAVLPKDPDEGGGSCASYRASPRGKEVSEVSARQFEAEGHSQSPLHMALLDADRGIPGRAQRHSSAYTV